MSRLAKEGPELTLREIQILRLIADGLQAKEIAYRLDIGTKTVEFHKTKIYVKIGVANTAGATRFAIREGFFKA